MKSKLLYSLLPIALTPPAMAADLQWSGVLDLRAATSQGAEPSWTAGGLGKTRAGSGLYLGQAMLRAEGDLVDSVDFAAVANAYPDRPGVFDLTEAWLRWSPVPGGAWRARVKAGAFFPALSLENDGLGWTPTRTLSTSAVNSWIGEEIRIKGVEFQMARPGRPNGSPHDVGVTATLFGANDPAGTVLAWRGWSIGDRISGLTETLRLPDLPVYRPDGAIAKQTRDIHLFRELDHRVGYALAANYGYAGRFDVALTHYDNRGDPLIVKDGQYSWNTRFNHVSARLRPAGEWEILLQALSGSTLMGANAVNVGYRAYYALLSHPLGAGDLTLRYDHFTTRGRDDLPADDNDEDGHALALAYNYHVTTSVDLVLETLQVDSRRGARRVLGFAPQQDGRSLTAALRWRF